MPRIPDVLIDCVVYLYPSVEDAKTGATSDEPGKGGTGFLVQVPIEDSPVPDLRARYIVTNSHVVGPTGRSTVVRINTVSGGFDVLPLTADDWIHHPDGDDVAIARAGLLSGSQHKFGVLEWSTWALSQPELQDWKVGPGDDVYFLGRFRYQEGRSRNLPTVRQGNIARMPLGEGVINKWRGIKQESFIVEAHSLSGYSGSPVFLYIPPNDWRGEMSGTTLDPRWHQGLLGMDWGHEPDISRVLGADRETPWDEHELWMAQNSGLMYVVPAWRIESFLIGDHELQKQRTTAALKWVETHPTKQ